MIIKKIDLNFRFRKDFHVQHILSSLNFRSKAEFKILESIMLDFIFVYFWPFPAIFENSWFRNPHS